MSFYTLLLPKNIKLCNSVVLAQAKVSCTAWNNSNAYSVDVRPPKPIKIDNNKACLVDEIIIPKRIPRGPTDILKALASTVKRNPSSPHYKYEDDPYLLPVSNTNKRSYALSKEAGKKAAAFMLQKYPDSFAHNPAEPNIPVFNAPIKFDESDPDSPEALQNYIECFEMDSAINTYKLLKSKGTALSDDILQQLLELVCYYGSKPQDEKIYFEERWLKQIDREQIKTKWQENNLVYEIFNDIQDKNDRTYCIMVKGLAKHFQIERSYILYKEMKDKKFVGDVEMYNQILLIVPYLRESSEQRWNLVKSFIEDMTQDNVNPNIGTFNSLLENVVKLGKWHSSKELALEVFSEMKQCGIEPSLGSYYYLLMIYCKNTGPTSFILKDIMKEISGKQFYIRHTKDLNFFVTAMDVCNNHLSDPDLALKVHDLYQFGENTKLIGNAFTLSIYYQNLLKVMCRMEDIEKFFEFYNTYVPHSYTPEPSVMEQIIEAISLSGKLSYLPQIWSDIILFNHTNRERIVSQILGLMAKSQDPNMQESFTTIASDIKERVQSQQDRSRSFTTKVNWTSEILDDMMKVFLNASNLEKAWEIFKIMNNEQATIMGYPKSNTIQELCKLLLEHKQFDRTVACVKFASEIGQLDVISVLKELIQNIELDKNFKQELEQLLSVAHESNQE